MIINKMINKLTFNMSFSKAGDVFFSILQSSPVSYSIVYILIFSATKQVGALLFSLAFWSASTLVYDDRIHKSFFISSIGMAILFGTFDISPLQYHVYPPYGFITQAFIPLGAYLLFVGIFTSAKNISRFRAEKRILQKCSKPADASKGYRSVTDGKGARK
jgi:hypothetical protein